MHVLNELSAPAAEQVRALVRRAAAHDGAAALDDAALLALEDPSAQHLLVVDGEGAGAPAVGVVSMLSDGTVQGVVDPAHRRRGHGARLLEEVERRCEAPAIWIHGTREESYSFLHTRGYDAARTLLQMRRELTAEDAAASVPELPTGLEVRAFDVERDADDWVALNARAFSDHPEQGSWTCQDLQRRLDEDWFEPTDLTVVRRGGALVAFCWIKRATGEDPELHVLATAPEEQGRGLAGTLLSRDIIRLARDGQRSLTLYTEGNNGAARGLYERRGFVVCGRDVQMRRRKESPACA